MPGIVVGCACGEVYELRPEYAGRLLECPVCSRRLRAGRRPGEARRPSTDLDPAFDRDVFLLNQRALRIGSEYEVWSQDGHPVLYVERPTYPIRTVFAYVLAFLVASFVANWVAGVAQAAGGLVAALAPPLVLGVWLAVFLVVSMSARPVRHVTVYRDDSRRDVLLRVLQDQRVAVLMRTYTVVSAAGEPLARLRKVYVHNLFRKRWYVETPSGAPVAVALEDSVVLSLLRRVLGTFFGLLRTNFVVLDARDSVRAADGPVIGEFNRKFTLFDRYVLDLTADESRVLDRRVALALGVMLDTGERR